MRGAGWNRKYLNFKTCVYYVKRFCWQSMFIYYVKRDIRKVLSEGLLSSPSIVIRP